jgi:hypothetical protein
VQADAGGDASPPDGRGNEVGAVTLDYDNRL